MESDSLETLRKHTQTDSWHSISGEEALEHLRSAVDSGLTSVEAQRRLDAFGANELGETPRPTFWARLLDQLRNFLVMILIAASVISLALGDLVEAAAIMAIVVLNAVLGVVQETRAEESLTALKKMTAPEARVMRDGHQMTIRARDLVPGDIVLLETGNYVPADIRLLEAINLKIDEASLTGESAPVHKRADTVLDREIPLGDRHNTAYMGTLITYGRGRGVVICTGVETQIGLIAQMIQSFETEPTPLQRKLEELGRTLGIAALAICGIVFAIGVIRELIDPTPGATLMATILDLFIVAVSLAIAAVPEGLPAIVTICLALGMQRMVQRHALLRRLPAVEALGSATSICSDKTGTLTQNAMTVTRVWTPHAELTISGEGYVPEGIFSQGSDPVFPGDFPEVMLLLRAAQFCSDAYIETSGAEADRRTWRVVGDPTEGALVVAAAKAGLWRDGGSLEPQRVAEIPFDSERKRMTTIHDTSGTTLTPESLGLGATMASPYLAFTKGAPDIVLGRCSQIYYQGSPQPLSEAERQRILSVNGELASDALRVLGIAVRALPGLPDEDPVTAAAIESDLVFIGLAGMMDPPRPEVRDAIAKARSAGIKTVMITGDYLNTAIAIAKQINLLRRNGRALTGNQLDQIDDDGFVAMVQDVDVYARVSPQHKVRIVEALRRRGHIVAMTGDGVNDAPALKRADIGVAMGITGTDVSKETAAMVLTDDNYASIVSAVEEGRIIYSNIRKFVFYLLSCNVGEILLILLATVLGWPLPLTAIQLLVLNLITDGAPALALGLEKGDPDIMDHPPRPPSEPVINHQMLVGIVVQAIAITAAVLTAFRLGLAWYPDNVAHAQTMAFATLSLSELLRAYTARSEHYPIWRIGIFSNKAMQIAVATSLAILLAIIYIPLFQPVFNTVSLSGVDWLVLTPLILVPAVVAEITKIIAMALGTHSGKLQAA